jgi:F-type H+-transporting ATPase subunit b
MPPWSPIVLEHPADITDVQWLIIRTVGFVIVAAIVVKVGIPVLRGLLTERQRAIQETEDQVAETMRQTSEMRSDYQLRLERIQDEAEQRMADAVREADSLRDHILAEAREVADAIVRRAGQDVDQERVKAMVDLRNEFVDKVVQAAAFAASRSLDEGQHSRLIDDFVRNVGAAS